MSDIALLYVSMENGDEVLYVNQNVILSREADEKGLCLPEFAARLSRALGTSLRRATVPVPDVPEWTWDDVLESVEMVSSAESSVKVAHWEAYQGVKPRYTHQMDIEDHREQAGRVCLTAGALEGSLDDLLTISVEITSDPMCPQNAVAAAHVHFDGDNLAFSVFKNSDNLMLRLETDVVITRSFSQKGFYQIAPLI